MSGRSACRMASRKCAAVTSRTEALKLIDAMEWAVDDALRTKTHGAVDDALRTKTHDLNEAVHIEV